MYSALLSYGPLPMRPSILGTPWTQTYKDMASNLSHMGKWYSNAGVSIPSTRIGRYTEILNDLATRGLRADADLHNVLPALYEVRELFEIWEGFRAEEVSRLLLQKLRHVVGGSANIRDEQGIAGKNAPRNTAFELVCAADAKRRGLAVKLRNDVDFSFEYGHKDVLVECKRIYSINMSPKRMLEGFKQLRRVGNGESPETILMLDFSRALNPDFTIPSFDTDRQTSDFCSKLLYDTLAWLKPTWQRDEHKMHIGFAARLSLFVLVRTRLELSRNDEWATLTYEDSRHADANDIFARLMHPHHAPKT